MYVFGGLAVSVEKGYPFLGDRARFAGLCFYTVKQTRGSLKMCKWIQNWPIEGRCCNAAQASLGVLSAGLNEHTTTPHLLMCVNVTLAATQGLSRDFQKCKASNLCCCHFSVIGVSFLKASPSPNLRFQDWKMGLTWDSEDYSCTQFGSAYAKIKAIKRRLVWPLHKDGRFV